jgi:hypothetical protein
MYPSGSLSWAFALLSNKLSMISGFAWMGMVIPGFSDNDDVGDFFGPRRAAKLDRRLADRETMWLSELPERLKLGCNAEGAKGS